MSTALVASNLVETRFWNVQAEQAAVNVLHFRVLSVTGGAVTDLDAANYLDSQMNSVYKPLIANVATYRGVQVAILGLPARPSTQFSNTHAGSGSGGSVGMSRQSAGLISWKTNLGGRRFRGRVYMPFPSISDNIGDGIPSSAYTTALTAWIAQLLASTSIPNAGATGTATIAWVLNHRAGKTPLPATVTDIVSGTIATAWATQRRRGSFGRGNTCPI